MSARLLSPVAPKRTVLGDVDGKQLAAAEAKRAAAVRKRRATFETFVAADIADKAAYEELLDARQEYDAVHAAWQATRERARVAAENGGKS